MTLEKSAKIILKKCLALKRDERCLIITDKKRRKIANSIFSEAKKIAKTTDLIVIREGKINGEEPDKKVAEKMLVYEVIIIPTTKSLTHTKARMNANKKGARIATMPGITEEIMERCIDINYDEMKRLTTKIENILSRGKMVKIITELGTNITINISGRKAQGHESGIFTKKGDFGNLPEGETFIAPMQKGTNGIYVVDSSQSSIGKLKNPIKITVKEGFATRIEGKTEAKKLKKILDSVKDKNAFNVAEFGIGTNKKAKITGNILEDEKVFGTCHIALGKNSSFGGDVEVPIHLDGIIKKPTIFVDGKKIMEKGKLVI